MCFKNKIVISLLITLCFTFCFALPVLSTNEMPIIPPTYDGTVLTESGEPVLAGIVKASVTYVIADPYEVITLSGEKAFAWDGIDPATKGRFYTLITDNGYASSMNQPVKFKVNVSGVDYDAVTINGVDASEDPIKWISGDVSHTFFEGNPLTITIPDSAIEFQVEGSATDPDVDMADATTVSSTNNTWELTINEGTGTIKNDVSASDLTIAGLPSGLNATAAKGADNTIVVTVAGTASEPVIEVTNVSIVVKGSAVTEAGAEDSEAIGVRVNPAEVEPIKVEGTATDSVVTMAEGNTEVSADNDWELEITEGTLTDEIDNGDLEITGLPEGLTWNASRDSVDTIVVTVTGTASTPVTTAANVNIVVKGSAVIEEEANDSDAITVTINPAPPPAGVLNVVVEAVPETLFKGQPLSISASATKDDEPEEVTWDVRIGGQVLDIISPSAEFTDEWTPEADSLPVEKEYTLEVTANFDGGTVITKTYEITFINYYIKVTEVEWSGSSVTASIENLGPAVSGNCVFQFFDGSVPMGCEVVSEEIPAEGTTITCDSVPEGADRVKVSVIEFGSGDDPWEDWNTLSSCYEFSLNS